MYRTGHLFGVALPCWELEGIQVYGTSTYFTFQTRNYVHLLYTVYGSTGYTN